MKSKYAKVIRPIGKIVVGSLIFIAALLEGKLSPVEIARFAKRLAKRKIPEIVASGLYQTPLHISDILDRSQAQFGVTVDRESLVSSLTKKVARGDRFLRPEKNTFSLRPETR